MTGRSVLVTGAGRGIGRAIALAFAAEGGFVALAGRDGQTLQRVAGEVEERGAAPLPLVLDVTNERSIASAFESYRRRAETLDVLVNNAGISGSAPVSSSDPHQWRRIVETNLVGPYLMARQALGLMGAGGRIVNVSSVLGRFGVSGYTAYCAAKHGIIGFTRALALELAPKGITVNAICPGWVDTEMARAGMERGARADGVTYEQFRDRALSAVPIGRMIDTAEVARLVRFLATPESGAITGQTYNICGGQTMD
jgi:NAD(P)-dependent dehydrogenase (short-subunit alcohol dehydrogenase family)